MSILSAARNSRPTVYRSCRRHALAAARLHSHALPSGGPSHAQSSVNPEEIAHFSRLSQLWWDERGEYGLLHKMNPVRVGFVRQKVVRTPHGRVAAVCAASCNTQLEMHREDGEGAVDETRPLTGMDVLDVGCGGGLLCETLARLGGRTLGIDASESNIAITSLHAAADPALSSHSPQMATGSLTYRHTAVEDLLAERGPKSFDVVCSMEVIEHVDNPRTFLANCASLVKPGGHLFLSTIARTPLSYFLTIFAAEQLLRLVVPGTHTHSKYINPDELLDFFLQTDWIADASRSAHTVDGPPAAPPPPRPWITRLYGGLPARTEAETRGLIYLPWKGEWTLVPRGAPGASIWGEASNYMFWVRRPLE
ncbi:S-adenosyl-L-methionine-dependent methyltransferase [Daedaleopsis nitida]|nr:S-adenosyl-L-methionine-dependent methyltransferase [Daedaleopsis nitida]